jgi:hypothetical protein
MRWSIETRLLDGRDHRIQTKQGACLIGKTPGHSSIAAANIQHVFVRKVDEGVDDPRLCLFWIK